jgi:hypothetical protein
MGLLRVQYVRAVSISLSHAKTASTLSAVRRSERVRFSPSTSTRSDEVQLVGRRLNGAAFSPDVAAVGAAPQADGKDRRANLQIPSQLGMTHRTDRHQRTTNDDSGERSGWFALVLARPRGSATHEETAIESGGNESTVRHSTERRETAAAVARRFRASDEKSVGDRHREGHSVSASAGPFSQHRTEGSARRGRRRGTQTLNTETYWRRMTPVSCQSTSTSGSLQLGAGTWGPRPGALH